MCANCSKNVGYLPDVIHSLGAKAGKVCGRCRVCKGVS